jgi:chromosomal replication initiation ATPase DnaA
VIEAVRYVTGHDPRDHSRAHEVIAARRLAVAALREICDLSYKACARALGYDHTTIIHHARGAVDMRLLKMVLARVNDVLQREAMEDIVTGRLSQYDV